MALDGAFLRHTAKEIEQAALGARVDKIYQPNREEIIVSLRSREGAVRLLLSARAKQCAGSYYGTYTRKSQTTSHAMYASA